MPTDKLFTGQRLDTTGLYYYNARYYDPNIGRFISPDTIVQDYYNPQTLNRYSYCINNPLKIVDPTGNEGEAIGVGIDEKSIVEVRSIGGGYWVDYGNGTYGWSSSESGLQDIGVSYFIPFATNGDPSKLNLTSIWGCDESYGFGILYQKSTTVMVSQNFEYYKIHSTGFGICEGALWWNTAEPGNHVELDSIDDLNTWGADISFTFALLDWGNRGTLSVGKTGLDFKGIGDQATLQSWEVGLSMVVSKTEVVKINRQDVFLDMPFWAYCNYSGLHHNIPFPNPRSLGTR